MLGEANSGVISEKQALIMRHLCALNFELDREILKTFPRAHSYLRSLTLECLSGGEGKVKRRGG